MPPRKKKRAEITKPTTSSRSRTTYNPSKHSLAALPYHILLTILTHAATTPGALHDWPSPSFLLSCATLCRTLHDPAIAALYRNPPTTPPTRARRLLSALRERPELGQKIKRLVVEVHPLLTTKVGRATWDVCEFVLLAKGLQDLQFTHEADNPPYREGPGVRLGWQYPEGLWDVLEGKRPPVEEGGGEPAGEGLRLKSWKWNGRFFGKLSFADIGQIHELRSLSTLTSISFIYIDTLDDLDGNGAGSAETHIAKLLSSLPALRDLKLECSSIANRKLLSLLSCSAPHHKLRSLRLINCALLTASDSSAGLGLTSFLQQPLCHTLTLLEVRSCQSCTLSFTTALSCTPALAHFTFDAHILNAVADASYTTLLPLSDAPLIVWPCTLQSLTATSLRKWTSAECIAFLESLVGAAPGMQCLRRVAIWSMLSDIDWRERAEFREKWAGRVGTAFAAAEKVEVRFDNARPAELLWGEDDFLMEGSVFGAPARPARGRKRKARGGGVVVCRRGKVRESESDEDYN